MIRPRHESYTLVRFQAGVQFEGPTVLSKEQVEKWLADGEWFNNLVAEHGQKAEVHRIHSGGVITVTQWNPEGVEFISRFVPVEKE